MARPPAKELTERELEIMHVFWENDQLSASDVRERLGQRGRKLAYTTVATLIRILMDKGFLEQINNERPFVYCSSRSFEDVSRRLVRDMVDKVFGGSRELLLSCLMDQRKLSKKERELLEQLLQEQKR